MAKLIFIFGAAGSGKTTFCKNFKHYYTRNQVQFVNLDPAAYYEQNDIYDVNVTNYISVEEIMNECDFGPNGGLFECLKFLEEIFFPEDENEEIVEELQQNTFLLQTDSIIVFDCPGQIELFLHSEILNSFIKKCQNRQNTESCILYLTDGTGLLNENKILFNLLIAGISVNRFLLPTLNLITKMDIVEKNKADAIPYRDENGLICIFDEESRRNKSDFDQTLCDFVDNYAMSSFLPINWDDDNAMEIVFNQIERILNLEE
ncbi:hypothetical protein NUSPORA_00890 [Nucleospora cyclopteri]